MTIQRILVGLDGSPLAETILPAVISLVKGLGASVTLLRVIEPLPEEAGGGQGAALYGELLEAADSSARTYLTGIQQHFQEAGIAADSIVATGDPATALLDYADLRHADLIALATHGRSGLQRWLYGSVAEKVLHTSKGPVLLLRPDDEQAEVVRGLARIIVPLDGSPLAEAALPMAATLASVFKIPVTIVRAVSVPSYAVGDVSMGGYVAYERILDALRADAQGYVDGVVSRLRAQGVDAYGQVRTGFPSGQIIASANEHAGSLVVMATHGRSGIVGTLLGSVARQVLRGAIPTLTVHPVAVSAPAA